jgi:hypothetical protein
VVARSDRAVLVMEPMRVVPSYAVPVADLLVPVEAGAASLPPEYRPVGFGDGGSPLLDPSVPFVAQRRGGACAAPSRREGG